MKQHHTKTKGDLGLLKCLPVCAEQGWSILLPTTEHSTYDYVIEKDGIFLRVQAKYRTAKDNVISIDFRSSWNDRLGTHSKDLNKSLVDIFSVYCPNTDKVYFFRPSDFKKSVILRLSPLKSGREAGIHYAKDYLEIK